MSVFVFSLSACFMHISIFSLLCCNLCPTRVLTWRSYPFMGHAHGFLGFWNRWCCGKHSSLPTPPFSFSLQLTFKIKRTTFCSNSGNILWLEKCYPFSVPFTSWEVQQHLTNWAGARTGSCYGQNMGEGTIAAVCNVVRTHSLAFVFKYLIF